MARKIARPEPPVSDAVEYVRRRVAADPTLAREIEDELDRIELAHRIRQARKERKLSQQELAARAGLHQPAVARIEAGRVVRIDLVQKVARAMGMRLDLVHEGTR